MEIIIGILFLNWRSFLFDIFFILRIELVKGEEELSLFRRKWNKKRLKRMIFHSLKPNISNLKEILLPFFFIKFILLSGIVSGSFYKWNLKLWFLQDPNLHSIYRPPRFLSISQFLTHWNPWSSIFVDVIL